MKIRGPILTMSATAIAGTAMWLANVSHDPAPAAQIMPVAAAPAPPAPIDKPRAIAPPLAFPAHAGYRASIPVRNGAIGLDITVDGARTTAYACDNEGIEVWLQGRTGPGTLDLASADRVSRLYGHLDGDRVAGTLWIGERHWDFRTSPAQVAGRW
jgi:hypothetical protein